jgi:hypothetical protein
MRVSDRLELVEPATVHVGDDQFNITFCRGAFTAELIRAAERVYPNRNVDQMVAILTGIDLPAEGKAPAERYPGVLRGWDLTELERDEQGDAVRDEYGNPREVPYPMTPENVARLDMEVLTRIQDTISDAVSPPNRESGRSSRNGRPVPVR